MVVGALEEALAVRVDGGRRAVALLAVHGALSGGVDLVLIGRGNLFESSC